MRSRTFIEDVIYGKRRSMPVETLLLVLSFFYRGLMSLRLLAYRLGVFRTCSLPVPVVSVGNITLGGTGKTPTVVEIAGMLQKQGHRIAVLSRGYGRNDPSTVRFVSDGHVVLEGPERAGDEPCMIAHRLPGVAVVVGADRCRAGREALARLRPDRIVLDDGFQHVKLKRDRNVVVIDGTDPFGNRRLFPAGILREPLSALKRADAILVTKADRAADPADLRLAIRKHTKAPIFSGIYRPEDLVEIATGRTRSLEILRGAQVIAFAGIARPASFEATLRALGAELASFRHFPDHYRYAPADLTALVDEASRSASLLVTTEKDGVKLKSISPREVWMLRVSIVVLESDAWKEAVWEGL